MNTALAGHSLIVWFWAARPLTLPLSLAPVLVGLALALVVRPMPDWPVLLATLLAATAIQVATNLLNDAEDFERGNDTAARRGPARASASGWLEAGEVRSAAFGVFAFAALCGVYLVAQGGWPIFWIGVFAIISGMIYSAGPRPISHTPLGELFVFVFFGVLAVSGSFYLQTGFLSSEAVFAGMSMGSFAAAVLHTNNVRDMAEDRQAGRYTLAIVIDRLMQKKGQSKQQAARARAEIMGAVYGGFIFAPYSFLVMHPILFFNHPVPVLHWLPLLSLPGAALAVHAFTQMQSGAQANRLLTMTIGLQLLFASLYAVSYLLG